MAPAFAPSSGFSGNTTTQSIEAAPPAVESPSSVKRRPSSGSSTRTCEPVTRARVTHVQRWVRTLWGRIDRCIHSTRFLRNENPPETRPLNFLKDGGPGAKLRVSDHRTVSRSDTEDQGGAGSMNRAPISGATAGYGPAIPMKRQDASGAESLRNSSRIHPKWARPDLAPVRVGAPPPRGRPNSQRRRRLPSRRAAVASKRPARFRTGLYRS